MPYINDHPSLKQLFEQNEYWIRADLTKLHIEDKKELIRVYLLDSQSVDLSLDVTKWEIYGMLDGKTPASNIIWKSFQWDIEELFEQFLTLRSDYHIDDEV